MPTLEWGVVSTRRYEIGLDRGVLYPMVGSGVAWNGLISVEETVSGGETKAGYQDGIKQSNTASGEEFEASLEAFTYPEEFAECDGTVTFGKGLSIDKQPRKSFGLSYRTLMGNDVDGRDLGYKIHLVYNALASPASRTYETLTDGDDPTTFNWDLTTTPIVISGKKAGAHLVIDSTKTDPYLLAAFEELLYGAGEVDARLPTPAQVISLFTNWVTLLVVDHGDGTWTASGPDPVVHFTSETEFEIAWHSANPIDAISYTLSTS